MRGKRSIDDLLAGYRSTGTNAVVAYSSVRIKSTRLYAYVFADEREAAVDRSTWDMSPANEAYAARSRSSSSAILDVHQLFLTCINAAATAC
ncbi:hypothetical protein [Bradyrhizobium sp. USDA 4486]